MSFAIYQGAFTICNQADSSIGGELPTRKSKLLAKGGGGPAGGGGEPVGSVSDPCPDFAELTNSAESNMWMKTVPSNLESYVYSVCPICGVEYEHLRNMTTDYYAESEQTLGQFTITRGGQEFTVAFSCTAAVRKYNTENCDLSFLKQ